MEIIQNNIDELNATIKITLGKADYEGPVNDSLKQIRRRANVKGFRPGQAPMGLIKKDYLRPVMAEEINKLLSKNLFNYLKDNNVDYLGEPLPSIREKADVDFSKDSDYTFYFDLALAPKFDVAIDSNLNLTQYVIDVENENVDKGVEAYKNAAGKNEPAETSSEKSMLKGEVYQLNDDGSRNEEGLSNKTSLLVSKVENPDQKAKFIDKKVGDEINFDLKEVFKETEAKAMLGNNMVDFNTVKSNFAFKIEEILDFVPGEITQELYDKFFGKDKVHNEDELRAEIRSQYEKAYEQESDYKLMLDARNSLIAASSFNVPLDFMKRWMLSLEQYKDWDEEKLTAQFPQLENDIKWNLIQNRVVKDNNIEVTADEELAEAKKVISSEFVRYGIPVSQIPADMLDNLAKERLAKDNERNMVHSHVISEKITALVKEKATLTQQNISYEDFGKLFE
jgi:trigger factor